MALTAPSPKAVLLTQNTLFMHRQETAANTSVKTAKRNGGLCLVPEGRLLHDAEELLLVDLAIAVSVCLHGICYAVMTNREALHTLSRQRKGAPHSGADAGAIRALCHSAFHSPSN